MTECRSPELQDLLPDYLADVLDDVTAARIGGHLDACVACREDLSVLRQVRQARPRVPMPDVARIVAALPPAPAIVPSTFGDGRYGAASMTAAAAPRTPPSMRHTAKRGEVLGLSVWRLAATVGLVVAGGASLRVARHGLDGLNRADGSGPSGGRSAAVASATLPPLAETLAVALPAGGANTVSVSYGDLGDYSEDELQRMLERLDQWDGATSPEPLPGVPIMPTAGGNTP